MCRKKQIHTGIREETNTYRVTVWKPQGKTPLGRTRIRWQGNSGMNLRVVE